MVGRVQIADKKLSNAKCAVARTHSGVLPRHRLQPPNAVQIVVVAAVVAPRCVWPARGGRSACATSVCCRIALAPSVWRCFRPWWQTTPSGWPPRRRLWRRVAAWCRAPKRCRRRSANGRLPKPLPNMLCTENVSLFVVSLCNTPAKIVHFFVIVRFFCKKVVFIH